ncbi:formyl transferase [Ostertagia ostertagi]
MAKLKVGVLISGRGSNLAALIEAARAADYPAEISCVVSNKADAPGLAIASAAGVPTATVSHKDHPDRESFDRAVSAELERHGVELVVLAGFMRIFSPCVNLRSCHYCADALLAQSILPPYAYSRRRFWRNFRCRRGDERLFAAAGPADADQRHALADDRGGPGHSSRGPHAPACGPDDIRLPVGKHSRLQRARPGRDARRGHALAKHTSTNRGARPAR